MRHPTLDGIFATVSPPNARRKDSVTVTPGHQFLEHRGSLHAAGRGSLRLTDEEVMRALRLVEYSNAIGTPLNRLVTILWERAGITDAEAATASFVKSLTDHLRRQGFEGPYLWSMENGPRQGVHVHILHHLPPELGRTVGYRHRGWLASLGARYGNKVINSKVITGRLSAFRGSAYARARFFKEQQSTVAYLLKCCSFEMRNHMRSSHSVRSSFVVGRRLGMSHIIRRERKVERGAA